MLTRSMKMRFATAAVLVCAMALGLTAVAGASSTKTKKTTKTAHKTVMLLQGQTKTVDVPYPQALKHAGAKYSCTAKASGPAKGKVRILSRGSALGGSVCRVKARNRNKFEDPLDDARIKITTTTTY